MPFCNERYPKLSAWVKQEGRIEIGYSYHPHDRSFLRVIQYTDLIWSSDQSYASLDEALAEMEDAVGKWCDQQGITLEG